MSGSGLLVIICNDLLGQAVRFVLSKLLMHMSSSHHIYTLPVVAMVVPITPAGDAMQHAAPKFRMS